MKYRTDFVTNSSSESFFIGKARFFDGTSQKILEDYNLGASFDQKEDGLYIRGSKIKSKEELCAVLYFGNDDYEDVPVSILSNLFLFIIQKIDCIELVKQIRKIADLPDNYHDGEGTLNDKFDFSVLEEIVSDCEKDIDTIVGKILGIFCDYYEETFEGVDEERLEDILKLYNNSIPFEKIAFIEIIEKSSDYGEFLGEGYFDILGEIPDDFHQISEDDPLFEKEENRWNAYLNDQCAANQTQIEAIYVHDALISGDYGDLIGSFSNERYIHILLYPNGIANSLETFCGSGEIPDSRFVEEWIYTYSGVNIVIPSGIKRIGRNAFKDSRLRTVMLTPGLTEIGSFAFDAERNDCQISGIPDSIEKIGVTMVYDLLEYAVRHHKLSAEEYDFFIFLDFELRQYGPNNYRNQYYSNNPDPKSLRLLAENNCLPKSFSEYPVTDLLERAMKLDAQEYLDILIGTGFKLDFADIAHYIYNDTLETLYPLFEKGLKIEASVYDALIDYSTEHGKAEFTAWLLNRKNEAAPENGQ